MKCHIEKLDYEGRGISREKNKVVFIEGALPEEVVEAKKIKEEKHFDLYKATEILKPALQRQTPFCLFAKECGGCTFAMVSYRNSLIYKETILKDLLEHNGFNCPNLEIIPSPKQMGYRNKISLKIHHQQPGYYKENTHDFVPITNCLIALPSIQKLVQDFSLFNIEEGSITIRSNKNDELLLIIESQEEPKLKEELIQRHKIAGIIWNEKCLYNSPFFFERLDHLLYKVNAESFFQVNLDIAEKIAQDILMFFSKEDIVYDLYCGVGYFSLKLARFVKQVIGVEINPKAILNATYNASLNNLSNTSFHVGKVEEILPKLPYHPSKILIDPPRSGLAKQVIQTLLASSVPKIVYISCNPKTFVRDLKKLTEKYEIKSLKAYDMFPYTKHMEVCAVLELKDC